MLGALERAGVPYMLVGSMASSAHGAPRTTQDVDIVVDLTIHGLRALIAELDPTEFYVSAEAALEALRTRGQFNVISMTTGWKADLIVRKQREFSFIEFGRRTMLDLFGLNVWAASPEDTIIAKLEWSSWSGGSERQRRDVATILERNPDALDLEYVEHWVAELDLHAEWDAVRASTGIDD